MHRMMFFQPLQVLWGQKDTYLKNKDIESLGCVSVKVALNLELSSE